MECAREYEACGQQIKAESFGSDADSFLNVPIVDIDRRYRLSILIVDTDFRYWKSL